MSKSNFHILAAVLAPLYRHGQPAAAAAETAAAPVPSPSVWAEQQLGFHPQPRQREVLDHSGPRLVLCAARQWGKSTVLGLKALHAALFHPGQEILVISHSLKQAAGLVAKVQAAAASLGLPRRRVPGHTHSLALSNGSRILAVAPAGDTLRGFAAHIVIVDEAAFVSDDIICDALTALARSNGRLWLASSPHRQFGLFYDLWHHSASPAWHRISATIDDAQLLGQDFLAEQRRLFPENFRRDFLCQFVPHPGQLISREALQHMLRPDLEPVSITGGDGPA
jgi:hypothetical protein